MNLLIQTNVVDKASMSSLANIAEGLGFGVVKFQNHKGEFFQGEHPLVLPPGRTYLPFVSVPTFDLIKENEFITSYSLEKYNTEDFIRIFGEENMLNPKPMVVDAKDIPWSGEELFIRPHSTAKVFKGGLYVQHNDQLRGLCAVSPYTHINIEYRFFIKESKIIGKSTYCFEGESYISSRVESDVVDFVEEQIRKFTDVKCYVIDVARTSKGLKIVELNTFNTSGFYGIDFYHFLQSL